MAYFRDSISSPWPQGVVLGPLSPAPPPGSLMTLPIAKVPVLQFRTLSYENEDYFFLSDFSLTCGSRYYLLSGFAPCLPARTIFKPTQTLWVLKITLSLLTPSRFGKGFLQTGNPSLSTCPALMINSPMICSSFFKLHIDAVIVWGGGEVGRGPVFPFHCPWFRF